MPKRIIMTEDNKPTVGYFLGVDGKYYAPNSIHGRQMIGYCAFKGLDGRHRIVAHQGSSTSALPWGGYGTSVSGIPMVSGKENLKADISGKEHTSHISTSTYPAAWYCVNYDPGYKKGDWYLPAWGEMDMFRSTKQNFLSALSAAGLTTNINWSWALSVNVKGAYQTSNQASSTENQGYYFASGNVIAEGGVYAPYKNVGLLVLPFLLIG